MMTTSRQSLALNSYKLDSRGYQQRIKQLFVQNNELKSVIQSIKNRQRHLEQELKNAKQQVANLRQKMTSEFVVHQKKCQNCASYAQRSMDKVLGQLQKQKIKVEQFMKMYESQTKNKKQQAEYYQKKVRFLLQDKQKIVNNYQVKLAQLSKSSASPFYSSTSSFEQTPKHNKSQKTMPQTLKKINQSYDIMPESHKKLPPTPKKKRVAFTQQKYIKQNQLEINFMQMLRPIKTNLDKMQIKLEQVKKIPQIIRFLQTEKPTQLRFVKLLRDFPFQCEDEDAILSGFDFVNQQLNRQGLACSGQSVIEVMFGYMTDL